jgi:hypothetical protein
MTERIHPSDEELTARIRALTEALPADTELQRVLLNIEDPANDEPSKDRYIALVSAGAVEEGLQIALAHHLGLDPADRRFAKGTLANFNRRIREAGRLGLITPEETIELDRIREVRNAFAHALTSVSFDTPEVAQITERLYNYPVTSWAGYFAPAFPARRHFAIVCGEFYANLIRDKPIRPRGSTHLEPDGRLTSQVQQSPNGV